jgi:hypothetical protein
VAQGGSREECLFVSRQDVGGVPDRESLQGAVDAPSAAAPEDREHRRWGCGRGLREGAKAAGGVVGDPAQRVARRLDRWARPVQIDRSDGERVQRGCALCVVRAAGHDEPGVPDAPRCDVEIVRLFVKEIGHRTVTREDPRLAGDGLHVGQPCGQLPGLPGVEQDGCGEACPVESEGHVEARQECPSEDAGISYGATQHGPGLKDGG